MTDEQLILIDEPAEHVRRVTLNRPHKRNAISTPLRVALLSALHGFDRDLDVRVTIVRGAGPCFSSGYDLSGKLTAESNTREQSTEPNCPPEVLEELATDPDLRIRAAAIANPLLPAAVLDAVNDPAATIGDAVRAASNPNSGSGLARRLAASDVNAVAAAAALIPACPTDVLESLAARPGETLLGAVVAHAACPGETLLGAVVAHAACPVDVLASTDRSRWSSIARAAAANPSCPADVLRVAARRRDDSCRRAVAGNLNCPPDVLSELLNDSVFSVAQAVATNPNCPNAALVDAACLGTSAITSIAVATLRSRMQVWPGAAPGPDV